MRTRKAFYNTISAVLLQVITIVVGLIIPRLIIEVYGSSVNGLRASITQFIGYLYIIEMGLAGALIYALYKPLTQNNIPKINAILSTAKKSYNQVGYFFSILVILMVAVYPLLIINEGLNPYEVRLLIFVIGLTGIINYFTIAKYNVLLTAAQCNYIVSLIRIAYLIINTFIMVTLMKYGLSISVVFLYALVANILQVYITKIYIRKHYNYIDLDVKPDLITLSKRFEVLIHQISEMLIIGSPVLLLTLFSSLEIVSVFSIYLFIFLGITMVLGVFQSGFSAGFGQIISQGQKDILKTAYSQYELLFYMLLTFFYVCTFILGMHFIRIYTVGFTDANYINIQLFYLFIILGIINNWKKPQTTLIFAAGHFKETRNRAIIHAVITIVTSTILVLWIGMIGVVIGSIIGHLYRSIDMNYAVKITTFPYMLTVKRLFRNFFTSILAIAPFITVISIEPIGPFEWVLIGVLVSIWVGLLVITINFIFERNTVLLLFRRVIGLFKKSRKSSRS